MFLITNIWPTWRHVQTSEKNLGVFVCCWGGGGGGERETAKGRRMGAG